MPPKHSACSVRGLFKPRPWQSRGDGGATSYASHMMRLAPFSALLLLALGSSACAQTEPDLVRAKAASDLACDKGRTTVREVRAIDAEDTLYEATACGKTAQYRCSLTDSAPQVGTRAPGSLPRPITSCVLASTDGSAAH
jgi:hypothetical protein